MLRKWLKKLNKCRKLKRKRKQKKKKKISLRRKKTRKLILM